MKISGTGLEISKTAYLIPLIVCLTDAWLLFGLCAVSVAVHELGHWAALTLCGGRTERVTLSFFGVSLRYGGGISYGGEIYTALAGPGASLILSFFAAGAGRLCGAAVLYELAGVSLLFCLFNLLPLYPLDGGRAIYNALAYFFGLDPARRLTVIFRRLAAAAIAAGGLWLFAVQKNPMLLVCAAALLTVRT
ncbi:MAG: hypothetical protein LBC78_00485 [Oscillospiraceae bacterium]|nr:hypothetical protein [Oscillospiraceae bacterium]